MMIAGKGDLLPVSALPVDGTFPTGTARFEKRSIALQIPIWDPDICIECGLCALVCPHAAIRSKAFAPESIAGGPKSFLYREAKSPELKGEYLTIQVAPDDCTGCGVCVDVCPARSKEVAKHKAINMSPKEAHLEIERERFDYFLQLPEKQPTEVKTSTVKGSQLLEPLFEFSGACAGCGETPYLKILTQLFGDRMVVANATGCSSIYGGNLPTTPWSTNREGRGPAWSNSLFEDNAEFGLGMRLALDQKLAVARQLFRSLASEIGGDLAEAILKAPLKTPADLQGQRERLAQLRSKLDSLNSVVASQLSLIADVFVPRSVWIVGGDGWAYDIGFGGLDQSLPDPTRADGSRSVPWPVAHSGL